MPELCRYHVEVFEAVAAVGLADGKDFELYERNLSIILPRAIEKIDLVKGKKDRQGLTDLFTKLEFKSVMKHIDEWTS